MEITGEPVPLFTNPVMCIKPSMLAVKKKLLASAVLLAVERNNVLALFIEVRNNRLGF